MNDIMTSVKEINTKKRECVYILYADEAIAATTQKYDMDRFLESDESPIDVSDDGLEDAVVIYGIVLDPMKLPFEIPEDMMKDKLIYVIKDEGGYTTTMQHYESMEEATEAVEASIEDGYAYDIDDFAIILGENIGLCLNVTKAGKSIMASKVYD